MYTTSCVSAIDVYTKNIAQTQPSTSLEKGDKNDIEFNMRKTTLVEKVKNKQYM